MFRRFRKQRFRREKMNWRKGDSGFFEIYEDGQTQKLHVRLTPRGFVNAKLVQKNRHQTDLFMDLLNDLHDVDLYPVPSRMDGRLYIYSHGYDVVYSTEGSYGQNLFEQDDFWYDSGYVVLDGRDGREYYYPEDDSQYEWIEELELYGWKG